MKNECDIRRDLEGTPPSGGPPCANCGTLLAGRYCYACGQLAMDMRRPLHEFAEDILHSVLHFDSRMWLTVRDMFLKPGQLTIDWMNGRRAGRVPPVRMFLFLTFILFGLLMISDVALFQLGGHIGRGSESAPLDIRVLSIIEQQKDGAPFVDQKSLSLQIETRKEKEAVDSVTGFLNIAAQDPKKVSALVTRSLTQFIIIAVPVMAILLKLLYIRRKRPAIEHLVFAFHAHTAFFAGLLFSILLAWASRGLVSGGWLLLALWCLFSAHFLIGMKRVYGQGWIKTALKSALLIGGYTMVLLGAGIYMLVRSFS